MGPAAPGCRSAAAALSAGISPRICASVHRPASVVASTCPHGQRRKSESESEPEHDSVEAH